MAAQDDGQGDTSTSSGSSVVIDPWDSTQFSDYTRLRDQFGLSAVNPDMLPEPGLLQRRGLIFAHRDLDVVLDAWKGGRPFGVLTGLMPSGRMHLGHKMVLDQVGWFQRLGADVNIAVADLEALATRDVSLATSRDLARREYIANYAALGLDPARTSVYYQSSRPIVQRLGFILGRRTNLSEMGALYGFDGPTNLAHVQAPLVQAGDILHPQLDPWGGLRPIVVPVGVDQDPHLRFTRGMAAKSNWFNVKRGAEGLQVALSVQQENQAALGVGDDGRVDKAQRQSAIDRVMAKVRDLGFSDIRPNAKHGTVQVPSATGSDSYRIRHALLDLERDLGGMGLMQPASTYHRFATSLTGGKMSSSQPDTSIFMTDEVDVADRKVDRAVTGGRATVEEQQREGGRPDACPVFELYAYHFQPDDAELADVHRRCSTGSLLCGTCKQMAKQLVGDWLVDHAERRDATAHLVDEFMADDAREMPAGLS